jgi:hypothetical protein
VRLYAGIARIPGAGLSLVPANLLRLAALK